MPDTYAPIETFRDQINKSLWFVWINFAPFHSVKLIEFPFFARWNWILAQQTRYSSWLVANKVCNLIITTGSEVWILNYGQICRIRTANYLILFECILKLISDRESDLAVDHNFVSSVGLSLSRPTQLIALIYLKVSQAFINFNSYRQKTIKKQGKKSQTLRVTL